MFLKRFNFVHVRLLCNDYFSNKKSDRFGGVHIVINDKKQINLEIFNEKVKDLIKINHNSPSIWFVIPMSCGHLLDILYKLEFRFHSAEGNICRVYKWQCQLSPNNDKVPIFGTHQIGIAAAICHPNRESVLFVKEKNSTNKSWKLPTGITNLSEDIGTAAEREVFEETGLKTNFVSILSIWQRHNFPSAFGRSDLLVLCRMELIKGQHHNQLNLCPEEIDTADWLSPSYVIDTNSDSISEYQKLSLKLLQSCLKEPNEWSENELISKYLGTLYSKQKFPLFMTRSSWNMIK